MDDVVLLRRVDAVAYVVLNRPDVHNAFNEEVIARMTEIVTAVSTDDSVRVVVFGGAGKSFCAGADLDWMRRMAGNSYEDNLADAHKARALFEAIDTCPKTTIATVHGAALGGGAGLVATCDIALAVEGTKFGFTEVRLGIIPAVISPFVVRKIGMGHARALFVTGRRFDAADALTFGLVQRMVPADQLETATAETIADALQAAPDAVSRAKSLLRNLSDGTADTAAAIASARASEQGREGLSAFLEKRKPEWAA
ncbi:MAG: enoyl-CoA hydratase-related protein [Armatimonas sp.]